MQQSAQQQLNSHEKILLVTAQRVGDALFTTPGIHALKQAYPEKKFDVLVMSNVVADLFAHNPDINEIKVATNNLAAAKIANSYPLVINLMHEMLKFLDKVTTTMISIHEPDIKRHRAEQVIQFVQQFIDKDKLPKFAGYDIFPQTSDADVVKNKLIKKGLNLEKHQLIGLQLGCHRVARRGWKFWNRKRHRHIKVWPIENYITLTNRLCAANENIKVILTGSPQEKYLANIFQENCPQAISMIGETSILQLASLMDQLKLLITHDTGTMHIACARQTPLVCLFGPTPVEFTGPYPKQPFYEVIAKPRMGDIAVDEVYSAAMQKLA